MPLLVLANKQDVAHAAKRAAVTTALGLAELTGRVFLVQETGVCVCRHLQLQSQHTACHHSNACSVVALHSGKREWGWRA